MILLDHHAPIKKKILRGNNAPYITKKLRSKVDYIKKQVKCSLIV